MYYYLPPVPRLCATPDKYRSDGQTESKFPYYTAIALVVTGGREKEEEEEDVVAVVVTSSRYFFCVYMC